MPAVTFSKLTETNSASFTITPNAFNNTCLVFVYSSDTAQVTDVTYNGVDVFTEQDFQEQSDTRGGIYTFLRPTQSTGNIVVTGGAGNEKYGVFQLQNVGSIGNVAGNNNVDTSITATPTGFATGDMAVGVATHRTNENGTLTGGGAEDYDTAIGGLFRGLAGRNTSSAEFTWTWSSSVRNALSAIILKQVPASGAAPFFF